MRFLLRMLPWERDPGTSLGVIRGIAANLGARVVNPKWTSYGALEIDVFAENGPDFEVLLAAIEPLGRLEFAKNLSEAPRFMPKEQVIREAKSLFNAERFWESHEALESLWRISEGEEKLLLQGLILVCAALVHQQKGEKGVALGIVGRAIPKLTWKEPGYHGIDLAELRTRMVRTLETNEISVFRI